MKVVKAESLDNHDRRRFNELRRDENVDSVVEKEFNDFIDRISCFAGLSFTLNSRGSRLIRSKKCDGSKRS